MMDREDEARALGSGLRGAAHFDDREMPAPGLMADVESKADARATSDEDSRRRARRTPRPVAPRFIPRSPASGVNSLVELIGSSDGQRRVRSASVVPGHEGRDFSAEYRFAEGHEDLAQSLDLEGPDEAFEDGCFRETALPMTRREK